MNWRLLARRGLQKALCAWPGQTGSPCVLAYHSVDSSGSIFSVSAEALRAHIDALKARGWRFISLTTYLSRITQADASSAREVCLTFDDGMQNFHREAMPVLKASGVPAAVFVVGGMVGQPLTWMKRDGVRIRRFLSRLLSDQDRRRAEEGFAALNGQPLMTWAELRDLVSYGIEVHSHGFTHRFLDDLNDAELRHEMEGARKEIQDHLNIPADTVAYPYGVSSGRVQLAAADAGYQAGFVSEVDVPRLGAFDIGRIGVNGAISPEELGFLISPGGSRYLGLRRRWRDLKARKLVARVEPAAAQR